MHDLGRSKGGSNSVTTVGLRSLGLVLSAVFLMVVTGITAAAAAGSMAYCGGHCDVTGSLPDCKCTDFLLHVVLQFSEVQQDSMMKERRGV